ncbi:MAG: hypothetical protein DI570_30890 [Phenylobacterium zucineum]|nr:MAG: hypothetical protein DI570_30890 [Phenylobacterium zucineum]
MKTNTALQVIFAFFLGLVVVAFVGIGVNTFYPEPVWTEGNQPGYANWQLITGVILLVCATILLAVSLLLPESQGVLSNGVLLGGVFTMVYAVGMTVTSDRSVLRFVVVAAALAVTIGIGYLKFVRRRAAAAAATAAVPPAVAGGTGELADRLTAVEHKLDAIARALRG